MAYFDIAFVGEAVCVFRTDKAYSRLVFVGLLTCAFAKISTMHMAVGTSTEIKHVI